MLINGIFIINSYYVIICLLILKMIQRVDELKRKHHRALVQIFFFILINYIYIDREISLGENLIPLLNEYAIKTISPIQGVEYFYTFITKEVFTRDFLLPSLIIMSTVCILGIFFGPVLCGWVCPLGSFQDLISRLGKKLFKDKYDNFVKPSIDKGLRLLRIISLLFVITALIFNITDVGKYDPAKAMYNIFVGKFETAGLIVLLIATVFSLFIKRPYCRYLCPYGALVGFSNLIRIFTIRRNPDRCSDCNKCNHACPMKLYPGKASELRDVQCISCLECTSEQQCPHEKALEFSVKLGKKTVKMPFSVLFAIVLCVILGVILITSTFAYWPFLKKSLY